MLDLTLRQVLDGLKKYQPFIGTVIALLLIAVFLPGRGGESDEGPGTATTNFTADGGQAGTGTESFTEGEAAAGIDPAAPAGTTGGGTTTGRTTTSGGGGRTGAAPVAPALSSGGGGPDPLAAADCDRATGRIRIPTKHAPPCVPDWPKGADNGGQTHPGVTKDTIKVAVRQCDTPEGQAINAALGIDDTPEDSEATNRAYADLFNSHYQTYGRKVELVFFQCSGDDDDEAAKADAIKVATEMKAFATLGGPAVYINELAARGVLCVSIGCFASAAIENYLNGRPHIWGWYISNTQAYKHRMEYIGKRLCGRNAKWAGDPTFQSRKRKFAILSFNDANDSYRAGAEFGQRELTKYKGADGSQCSAQLMFQTLDVQKAQEDARVIVAKLKDDGVTSVLYTGDPISIIFISKEATNQQYFPEWVVGASVLTDTTFFGRLYDQQQWRNAFGISWNTARVPRDAADAWNLHVWHHGRPPQAEDLFGVIYPNHLMLFTGIHLAGPKLNVATFAAGMFSYPPTPPAASGITVLTMSFGKHGLWDWEDFTAQDDATEIWWDPQATGDDENGNQGVGMYRYVDGGKRYMPGQRPNTEPKKGIVEGTVLVYDKRPPQDATPNYEHKHYR